MLERPEAVVLAKQLNEALTDASIVNLVVDANPHKMAWLNENRSDYKAILQDAFSGARAFGGQVELSFGQGRLLVADGVNVRLWKNLQALETAKAKHQLMLTLNSGKVLTFSIQMYGGIWCYLEGQNTNPYYLVAVAKPAVESDAFDYNYFRTLGEGKTMKLSAKAFIATEQRIPGLGNGVLQDVLLEAGLHPKRKINSLSEEKWLKLYRAVKHLIPEMTDQGGRDTETDLLGNPGGYQTKLSKANLSKRCPHCHNTIIKEAYMGGSIYFCANCQPQQ